MNKFSIVLLTLIMLIFVSACDDNNDNSAENMKEKLPTFIQAKICQDGESAYWVDIESYEFYGDYICIHVKEGQDILIDKSNCMLFSYKAENTETLGYAAIQIEPSTTDTNELPNILNEVMYVNAEMTALYSDASLNNDPIAYLNRGDVVTLQGVSGSFSKVITTDESTGYILSNMLSDSDPTLGEDTSGMSTELTPTQ